MTSHTWAILLPPWHIAALNIFVKGAIEIFIRFLVSHLATVISSFILTVSLKMAVFMMSHKGLKVYNIVLTAPLFKGLGRHGRKVTALGCRFCDSQFESSPWSFKRSYVKICSLTCQTFWMAIFFSVTNIKVWCDRYLFFSASNHWRFVIGQGAGSNSPIS